ncbi:immunoglobulin superfamily member 10 [Hemiscyllium ocellatum]|uniref:immunoglobulin superfamily member 10 n=1 Tax=Hemiscyllium ocellatum TaxID=170820 RepID=UPI0029672843|nr:immunoglobulin superfamily member 10 [Hemiscyllium ocellatum]
MSAVRQGRPSLSSGHCGLLVTLAALAGCLHLCTACPKQCACYVPTEVHCTFRYLNAIPEDIQTQVERVNLGYNNLMELTSTSFTGLKSLELLMLHSNKIQEIPDKVFQDLQSLQVLKMSYNKIKALNRETFHGLRSIVRLHMDHNSIEFINPEAFYGLTSLKLLHLEGNMLQELHRDTFVTFRFSQIFKMSSIKHIYLSDNALTSIPSDLISYISELESIYLHGNQWFCDCNLRWLTELNERLPGIIKCKRDRNYPNGQICPLCATPDVSRGKDILQLPPSVFACAPPSIQSPMKISNSTLQEEGDYAAVNAKDFVAPLGQMSLNMSDQSGNGCEITCNIHRPSGTPQVSLDQKEGYVLLNSSLSTLLVCYVDYEQLQRLWGILAMYTDSPLQLEKDTMLSKTPHMSYLYKQSSAAALHQFTGVEMQIRANPAWLMQDKITLQMDRTQTTLNVLQIKYQVEVQINLQDLEAKPGKNSWVMIKKAKGAKTEHFVVVGGTVELECQAVGDPKPIIAWILPDGSKMRAPYSSDDSRVSVSADGKFILRIADLYDTGIYHCVGTNYQDADVLSFRVIVLDPNVAENYINGPYITKSGGDSIQLPCQATGIPNASISWVLPDHRVLHQTTGNKEITPNGTLKIKRLTTRDSGFYRCLAANRYGIDLLALQLTVTGSRTSSEEEIAESNDGAEENFGSGDSEEDVLEPEDLEDGQFSSQTTSEDETYYTTTSSSQPTSYPETSTAVPVIPRRRTKGSGRKTHQRPNRRRLKQPRRKVDPLHWAEYLAKVREKVSTKTATRKITIKPHATNLTLEPTADEKEASGVDLGNAEEEELIVVSTKLPVVVSGIPSHPITEKSTEISPQLKLILPTVKQFHTTELDAKAAVPPILKGATDSSLFPKVTETITKKEPTRVISQGPTATPHVPKPTEANAELQVTVSRDIKQTHYMPTSRPTPLTTDKSKEHTSSIVDTTGKVDPARTHDYHTHIAAVTMAKEDGNRILFKTTQTITFPLTTSLSTILTQQLHIVREATTGAPVSKSQRFGWRQKFPYRRRFGKSGRRRHRYKIVRPELRRPAWSEERTTLSTLMHSAASSPNHMPSVTQIPPGPPLPQPAPMPNGASTISMQAPSQQSGDSSASETTTKHTRIYSKEEVQTVSDAEVERTWSQWVTRADTGIQTAESETITQLVETSSVARPKHTDGTLSERSLHFDLLSTATVTTAEPSTQSSKVIRGKIPWNRLFGLKNQKDALRRLRKPIKSSQAKTAIPKMSIILTKPTPHSVSTLQAVGGSLRPRFSSPNPNSNQTKATTRLPTVFLHTASTTNPPTTVKIVPFTSETVTTTAATIQTTHATRRMGFRRRRPGKFNRTRKRLSSSWSNVNRNRLVASAAESRKMRPTKTRIPFPPSTQVATEASHDVAIAASATTEDAQSHKSLLTSVGVTPATITRQYNSKVLHLPSKTLTSQSTVKPLTTPNTIILIPPTSKTTTRGIPTVTLQSSGFTEATRWSTIRKKIDPTKVMLLPPATESTSASTTIVPSTQPSVLATTVAASSKQPPTTARSPPRTLPRFRITLHRFTTSVPPKRDQSLLPQSRMDTSLWQNLQTKAISTIQTSTETKWKTPLSFTEGPTRYRVAPPPLNSDLENTIGNEGGKDEFFNKSNALSPNVIAVDPMSQNHPSKPRLIGGNKASFTFVADSDAFIPCEATGNPLPIISWTKISTGATVTAKAKRGNKFEVFPNGTLTIQKITVQDRGQYLCIAENQYGSERFVVTLSVIAYPSKILEPRTKDITVHAGYPVEMKCRSHGRPAPTISWILSNRTLVRNSSPFNGRVSVLADGTLKIKAVTVYDQGSYRCVASNPAGIDTVIVKMQVVAQPPAILEARQENVKGQEGQNIRLPCTAVGTPAPSVHWQLFDGTEIKPLQFINTKLFVFTNGTLYVKSLTPSDSGNYECIATSSTGSERRIISLMVERKQEIPKIVSASSSNKKVNHGDKLQLHCSATGDPKPKIIWRLPSKLVVDQWHRSASRVLVWPNGTLSIESITERDAGMYLCIARNRVGDDMVSLKIDVSMRPALIEHKQSVHKHVSYGADLQVDCKASGSPKPEISWSLPDGTMVNNVLQADDSGSRTRRYIVFGNGTLYYNKVGMAEEGDYTCYAQNTLGKDEMKVHVTVMTIAPHIKKPHKESLKVTSGGIAMFDCQAAGKPLPRILWMLPTNEIISFSKNRYHLHSNGSLLIRNTRLSDAGKYMCIARNPGGDDTYLFRLDVASKPPLINGLAGNKTVIKEYAVRHSRKRIDCKVEGVPKPYITWIMPDNIMLNAPYYGSRIVVHLNGTLEIRNVRATDNAEFVCVARNDAGEATLVVNLEVTRRLRRPVFKNPFNKKVVASGEGPTILNCSADGYPPPEIIWILPNGTRFTGAHKTARYQINSNGTFLIHSPTVEDTGKYRCAAKNTIGYIEKLIILEVGQKPVIHIRPLGLIRSMSGDALYLHCSANGRPTPNIVWTVPSGYILNRPQINPRYILFENGTLVVREVSVRDRGNYICKAYNNAGDDSIITSVIVIAYPPRITNGPPKSLQVFAGSAVQLNCMAIGIPRPEIVWELPNHAVLSTFSKGQMTDSGLLHPQGTLAIQKLTAKNSGTYKCTAKSQLGSDSRVTYIQVI